MANSRTHIPSRWTVLWLLLVGSAIGVTFFLRAPPLPGIPRGWWAVFAVLIGLVFFASSLIYQTLANFFANGHSRLRTTLWCGLAIAVGIDAAIRMAVVIGPVGANLFGAALAILCITLDVIKVPSKEAPSNGGESPDGAAETKSNEPG